MTNDTFSQVVDRCSPLYRFWQYRVTLTGEVFCGTASSLAYSAGRSLVSGDTDDPRYFMNMNANLSYGSNAGTVKVVDQLTGRLFVLRDHNLSNSPPCK